MYRRLPFSPTRVLCGLAFSFMIAAVCAVAIHVWDGNTRPLVELALCTGFGAALSMALPRVRTVANAGWLTSLVRRPVRTHLASAKKLLLAPRRLQFSVRASLIYLTVFCVWLGMVVERVHRCEGAALAIELSGGRVVYNLPRIFGDVRSVAIARRDGPSDDATLIGLIPHIRSLRPRRIVIGSKASTTVVDKIKAAFPTVEVVVRGGNGIRATARPAAR